MKTSTGIRRALLAALIAAVGLALAAGVANGRATQGSFEFTETFSDTVDDSGTCLGAGAVGVINGTSSVSVHFTDTYPPKRGFHVAGTDTATYRIDYDDGRYIVGRSTSHFVFEDNPDQLRTVNTDVAQDAGALYAADGTLLGEVTVHAVFHITFSDTNGNFEPDPGEVTANVDQFRLTCP
jgi:hypothetical protein